MSEVDDAGIVAEAITMLPSPEKSKWIVTLFDELKEKMTVIAAKDGVDNSLDKQ